MNNSYYYSDPYDYPLDDIDAEALDDNPGHDGGSPACRPAVLRRHMLRAAVFTAITGISATALSASGVGLRQVLSALPGAMPPPRDGADESPRPAPPPYRFSAAPAERDEWASFKARFIDQGRVIDTSNHGVSHTEGQGSGLLFAVAFDDRPMFETILAWTRAHLRRPDDALHAWRYDPQSRTPVADWNNATDGDLLIAGALARAARRWGDPGHADAARAIAADIIYRLVRQVGGRTVLLPGAFGFEQRDVTIVNPSYYAFPLLRELAAFFPAPSWRTLINDGVALMDEARFGTWGLPPDWLQIDARTGQVAPARGWPVRFSYDAIRIPLYLAWGGCLSRELAENYRRFWNSPAGASAWVDLRSGTPASYPADPGMRAITRLVTQGRLEPPAGLGSVAAAPNYYAAALLLLSRIASHEAAGFAPLGRASA